MLNLRETTKNRRITLTNTMMQPFMTEAGLKQYIELATMRWSDLDDYVKKYDHRTNPENFAKRASMWNLCENFGRLYHEGLIDLETLYGGSGRARMGLSLLRSCGVGGVGFHGLFERSMSRSLLCIGRG